MWAPLLVYSLPALYYDSPLVSCANAQLASKFSSSPYIRPKTIYDDDSTICPLYFYSTWATLPESLTIFSTTSTHWHSLIISSWVRICTGASSSTDCS